MKKYYLLILALVFYVSPCIAQVEKCDCSVVLIPKDIQVPIHIKPMGKISFLIKNNTRKEDYCLIHIKGINENWANISSITIDDKISKNGWIKKKYLGIYLHPYLGDSVKLYSQPDTTSQIISTLYMLNYPPANIFHCKGKWLYIKSKDADEKMKEGWLSPDDQCSNPYTTCN